MNKNDFFVNELIYQLHNKNRLFRIAIFIWGVLIYAISFSLFFSPNNIVCGGSTGLSLVIKEVVGMETSLFVLIISLILLFVSYIFLGKYDTFKAVLGSMILPVFMEFSSIYYDLFDLHISSMFMIVFVGGLFGFALPGQIHSDGGGSQQNAHSHNTGDGSSLKTFA